MFPPVTMLICTYNREQELIETLHALHDNIYYEGERRYLICDDCTPPDQDGDYLTRLKSHAIWKTLKPRFIPTEINSGWGVNVNYGLLHVDTPYTFFVEDDYLLMKELDLREGVAIMEAHPHVGMIRYRGTAGDHLVYHQFEANIAHHMPDYHQGLGLPGRISYLQIDSGSPSVYIYSHGPHLKHFRFHQFYGMYPTGLKLGETEESYAHTVKDQMTLPNAPGIAILPDWIPMWWDHIGQSYQHTELDKAK